MRDTHEQLRRYHNQRVYMDAAGRKDIKAKAEANRRRLRNGLARDGKTAPFGSRTQGSYAMRTMIKNDAGDFDIDDGVYFTLDALVGPRGAPLTGLAARQMVCDALQDRRFEEQPEVRSNCVRIYYKDGYHVDVPVYRRTRTTDGWTGVTTDTYELASSEWKRSDALSVTKWFRDQNNEKCGDASDNGDKGQFVRLVRLLKAFARSRPHWSGKIAGGFALSRLVSDHFVESPGRDDIAFREVLQAIHDRLTYNDSVGHPTLDENILEAGSAKSQYLRLKLEAKLAKLEVLDDPDCSHGTAMKAWKRFFHDGWFSNQPDPDEDKQLDQRTSGPPVIKSGGQGYA